MIDIKEQQHNIKLLYGWSDEELLKRLGPGPYVMYGGGPDPPPPGLTIGGMPILHDPSMEFNCTRVAADTRGNDEHS